VLFVLARSAVWYILKYSW